ncbi:unnamed protein product [Soboliphyme baturini]|uniref:Annexin n=1 Tax=Soboliphyme baturini TaxID=241478 RepID=A0A183J1J7_9BILA|nr:unnamed protein product [Soboliphyme baturini]
MQQSGQYGKMYYGTVRPFLDFHPDQDAEALHKAMKGLGCNDKAVVDIICRRNNAQRQQIRNTFKSFFGKDLLESLKNELHGDLEDAILALMLTPAEYDAVELFRSMDGIGTNELVLIEILTTRTNSQIIEIKQKYREMYGKDLEKCLRSETSGHFRQLLVALSVAARDESTTVDPVRAAADAQALYAAGAKRLGTEESVFIRIIGSQNPYQLNAVFAEYQKICGKSIEYSIKQEFSGDIELALLTLGLDFLLIIVSKIVYSSFGYGFVTKVVSPKSCNLHSSILWSVTINYDQNLNSRILD